MGGSATILVFALTAVILVAWVVWAVVQYRRNGRTQWLWLAVILAVALLAMIPALR